MSWTGEVEQQTNGTTVEADVETAPEPVAEASASDEFKVVLSLAGGERIEVGEFPSEQTAHAQAESLMAAAAQATTTAKWPCVNGRYLRPETIVSIDVERSEQTRWTGSTGRASSWNSR
jgi:hypothetical protein